MAYSSNKLSLIQGTIGGAGPRKWEYWNSDSIATVMGSGYISDATKKGMVVGDIVMVFTGTLNTTGPDATTATTARGTVSEFASNPTVTYLQVSSISSGAATLLDKQVVGGSASSLVGFYGNTPIVRPSSTNEAQVSTAAITSVATTAATTATGTTAGYTTTTQANAIVSAINSLITQEAADRVLLNQIQADLVSLGLIKGTG